MTIDLRTYTTIKENGERETTIEEATWDLVRGARLNYLGFSERC